MENKNDVTTEDVKNGTGEDTADTTTEDTSDSKEKTGTKAKLSPDEEYAQLEVSPEKARQEDRQDRNDCDKD